MRRIDPKSPVPLYHQIAESIREQIGRGELSPGEVLEPMREAARTWGVNLHTVRHAYTALARDGLVELRGPRGTRVAGEISPTVPRTRDETIPQYIDRVLREAREHHGLNPGRLVQEISRRAMSARTERPIVYLVECSAWQCETHARELESHFEVEAREWSLERGEQPPDGVVVATYFHYNDIRRLWPHRLRDVRFVTIIPDPKLTDRLPGNARRVLLIERDAATAENVAADLTTLFAPKGVRVEPVVDEDPAAAIARADEDSIIFVPPRIWPAIPEAARTNRLLVADYRIDSVELRALGEAMGWRTTRSARSHRTVRRG